jgi:hypothetical protein
VTSAVTDVLPEIIARASDSQQLRGPPAHAPRSAQQDFPIGAREAVAKPAAPAPPPSQPGRGPQKPLPTRRIPG